MKHSGEILSIISPVNRGAGRKGGTHFSEKRGGKRKLGLKSSLEDEVRFRPFNGGTVFRTQME